MSFRDRPDEDEDEGEEQARLKRLLAKLEILEGGERLEIKLAITAIRLLLSQQGLLLEILAELRPPPPTPTLNQIKIVFGGNMPGPVTLHAGQSTVATVQGFDQSGNPFAIDFTAHPTTWTLDDPSQDTLSPNVDGSAVIGWLAGGKTANLTATVAGFSDTEQVINVGVVVPPPALASIKVNFATPTP